MAMLVISATITKASFIVEADYLFRCKLKGYSAAILKDAKCYHATGPYYSGVKYDADKWSHLDKADMYFHKIGPFLQFALYRIKAIFH